MATINLARPFALKSATFTIGTDDYTPAVSQAQFNPATSASTWRGIGGNIIKDQSVADWSLVLGFAQDLAPDGLTRFLLDHDGERATVSLVPVEGDPATITATVILSPGSLGGTAGAELAASSVTLAVIGKPTVTDGAGA